MSSYLTFSIKLSNLEIFPFIGSILLKDLQTYYISMTEKSPGLNGKTDELKLIKTKEIFRCLDFDFMTLLNFVDF